MEKESKYLLFANCVTWSRQGNTKSDLFVRPEIWRTMHAYNGFYLQVRIK